MNDEMPLFTPYQLGPYELAHRVVMAPMGRNRAIGANVPPAMMAEYYGQRASAGLIVSEATQVSPQGRGYPRTPGIHSSEQIAGWRKVTDAVHAGGGRIFVQLWHVGRLSHREMQEGGVLPVAPSAVRPAGEGMTFDGLKRFPTPRALETEEIPGMVEQWRHAAKCAMDSGFDGVEIEGSGGWLLDQFLRDRTNRRTDSYGGSVENRARLPLEITETAVEIWGADRVGFQIGPFSMHNDMDDSDPDALYSYLVRNSTASGSPSS